MAGKKSFEEARRFLRAPQEAARELAVRMEQLRRWRELAERTTSFLEKERVQQQACSRVESCACELAGLEAEIDALRERMHELRARQEEVLGKLEDSRLSQLLRLYYQCNFTFAEAAEHMGYSERQIMRLHTMALREVQNLLQEGSRCHLAS